MLEACHKIFILNLQCRSTENN